MQYPSQDVIGRSRRAAPTQTFPEPTKQHLDRVVASHPLKELEESELKLLYDYKVSWGLCGTFSLLNFPTSVLLQRQPQCFIEMLKIY